MSELKQQTEDDMNDHDEYGKKEDLQRHEENGNNAGDEHHATVAIYLKDKLSGEIFGLTNKHVIINVKGDLYIKSVTGEKIFLGTPIYSIDDAGLDIGLVKINETCSRLITNSTQNQIIHEHRDGINVLYGKEVEKFIPKETQYKTHTDHLNITGMIAAEHEHELVFGENRETIHFLVKNNPLFAVVGESGTALKIKQYCDKDDLTLVGIICGETKDRKFIDCLYLHKVLQVLNKNNKREFELVQRNHFILQEKNDLVVNSKHIPSGIRIFLILKTPEQIKPYEFDLTTHTLNLLCLEFKDIKTDDIQEMKMLKDKLSDLANKRMKMDINSNECDRPEYKIIKCDLLACDYLFKGDLRSAEKHLKKASYCLAKSKGFIFWVFFEHVTYVTWSLLSRNTESSLKEAIGILDDAEEIFDDMKSSDDFPRHSVGYLFYDNSRIYMKQYDNLRRCQERKYEEEQRLRQRATEKASLASELFRNMYKKENNDKHRTRMVLADSQLAYVLLGCGQDFIVTEHEIPDDDIQRADKILINIKSDAENVPLVQYVDYLIAECDLNYRKGNLKIALDRAKLCLDKLEGKPCENTFYQAECRVKYLESVRFATS